MIRHYLTIFLTLGILTAHGQNCEWSVGIMGDDMVHLVSKPLDIGEELGDGKVFLQIMFTQGAYLLVMNVKNETIKSPDRITLKSETGDLVAKAVDVNTKLLVAESNLILTDPARPYEKRTYFSELESNENRFSFFEVTPSDMIKFRKTYFKSFETTDISVEFSKPTSKQLRRMIGCVS